MPSSTPSVASSSSISALPQGRGIPEPGVAKKIIKQKADAKKKWEIKPVRAAAPGRLVYTRGSIQRILRTTSSTTSMARAASDYEANKLAPGSRRALEARVAFWARRAEAHGVAPFPLDAGKLKLLGVILHAGAYRSAASYFSAAKAEHIRRGGTWPAQFAKEVVDGTRSCTRGQGPDKQSAELDLDELAKFTGKIVCSRGWPIAGRDVILVMGCWMLREIEGGTARLGDVTLSPGTGCGRAAWQLPCSKTDVRALGHSRTHGCSCPDAACPTAAMRRVVAIAKYSADKESLSPAEAPLFPDDSGNFVKKIMMISFFKGIAGIMGKKTNAITGHMPRVSGARRMARAGVELWQIQLFARWESAVILRYVREAPLARSHLLAARLATATDFNEVVDNAVGLKTILDKEGETWDTAVTKKVEEALGGTVSGTPAEVDPDVLKKAALHVLTEERVMDLPEFVVNGRQHHSRASAHRPRDLSLAFCGWPWAGAVSEGTAMLLTSDQAQLHRKCEVCTRASAG